MAYTQAWGYIQGGLKFRISHFAKSTMQLFNILLSAVRHRLANTVRAFQVPAQKKGNHTDLSNTVLMLSILRFIYFFSSHSVICWQGAGSTNTEHWQKKKKKRNTDRVICSNFELRNLDNSKAKYFNADVQSSPLPLEESQHIEQRYENSSRIKKAG